MSQSRLHALHNALSSPALTELLDHSRAYLDEGEPQYAIACALIDIAESLHAMRPKQLDESFLSRLRAVGTPF